MLKPRFSSALEVFLSFIAISAASTALSQEVQSDTLRIYHRLLDPHSTLATPSFTPRGAIDVSNRNLTGSDTDGRQVLRILGSDEAVLEVPHGSASRGLDLGALLYQVTVEVPDEDESRWPMSSSKACHLLSSSSSIFTLLISASSTPTDSSPRAPFVPISVVHRTAQPPPPKNDACSSAVVDFGNVEDFGSVDWDAREGWVVISRVEVEVGPSINTPNTAASPNSQSPADPSQPRPLPTLGPDGKALPPATPPKKSFVRQYWMYIAAAVMLLFIVGSPEPPSAQQGPTGGGTAKAAKR